MLNRHFLVQLIGIVEDGRQYLLDIALADGHGAIGPKGGEVVELIVTQHNNVRRIMDDLHDVAIFLGNSARAEQGLELVHAQRYAPEHVRRQLLPTEQTGHLGAGKDQARGPPDLRFGQLGIGPVLQQEEGVEVHYHTGIGGQISIAPEFLDVGA